MCASSKVGAEISAASVPAINSEVFDLIAANCIPGGSRDNLTHANEFTDWEGVTAVSYTHLDVYKRQCNRC